MPGTNTVYSFSIIPKNLFLLGRTQMPNTLFLQNYEKSLYIENKLYLCNRFRTES